MTAAPARQMRTRPWPPPWRTALLASSCATSTSSGMRAAGKPRRSACAATAERNATRPSRSKAWSRETRRSFSLLDITHRGLQLRQVAGADRVQDLADQRLARHDHALVRAQAGGRLDDRGARGAVDEPQLAEVDVDDLVQRERLGQRARQRGQVPEVELTGDPQARRHVLPAHP